MTTAIYARISDDRADHAGVDRQLADCREFCEKHGWAVDAAHEYTDNSITASKASAVRKEYRAMMDAIKAGQITRVVCWMTDRLYRQPRELEDLIDLAIGGRVKVYSAQGGEGMDLSTIDGATVARVVVALANAESRKISARVLRQQAERRKEGEHHGATRPLGYERIKEGKIVRFVPKEDEATLIRKAMNSIIAGKSLADIAHEWTVQGVEHPAHSRTAGKDAGVVVYPWSPTSIGHILHSHRNLGRLTNRDGDDVGQGSWPAIVDRELFEQCNATIAQRRKRGTATPTRRKSLTGLMFCGGCGAKMTRGRSAKTEYYRCPGSSKEETYPCGKVGIVAPWVEELVMNTVVERLSVHDFKLDDDQPDNSPRLAAINARLDAIDATIKDAAKRTATAGRAESEGADARHGTTRRGAVAANRRA